MVLRHNNFKGLLPRVHPSALPEGMAQKAHNLVIKNTKAVPLKVPLSQSMQVYLENGLTNISDARTIYVWHRKVAGNEVATVLAWPGIVYVAQSNLADDDRDRLFVTGDTGIPNAVAGSNQPSVYFNNRNNGTIIRRTLVKSKPTAPVVTVSGEVDHDTERYTYYFQTWVDKYGYESPVSDASEMVTYNDGQTVTIGAIAKPDSQAYVRRIYKTVTGDNSESNRFVAEFSGANAWSSHEITIKDAAVALTETMPAVEAPPSDLRGIVYVPGNYYAGFSKSNPRTVYFSDVLMPYSWPEAYQYDVHDDIVGLACSKNTVFALTDNRVWILRGTYPDTMVASALSPAACVSEKSIVEYNNNVFFATNFGLCMVHNTATDGDVVTNVTEKLFTKEQWRALNPSSCQCYQIDGRILAFFTVMGEQKAYIFDLNESDCMLTTHDINVKCGCVDAESDQFMFVGG